MDRRLFGAAGVTGRVFFAAMENVPESQTEATEAGAGRFKKVQVFDSIDSTNTYLLAAAQEGAPDGLVAVARYQSAGRGRLGRSWTAPAGSALLFSCLLRPRRAMPPENVPLLTLAAGVAMLDALWRATGTGISELPLTLKWPNDVLLSGRKLAGILAESVAHGSEIAAVVVGCGVNMYHAALPPDVAEVATSLEDAGFEADAMELLNCFLGGFSLGADSLEAAREPLLDDYRRVCETIGQDVRVLRTPDDPEPVAGRAVAIDDTGALVLRDAGGRERTVASGEVFRLR